MNAIRLTLVGLLLIAAVSAARVAYALQLDNSGNGAGSQNSIDITGGQSTNVWQNNQGSINNDVSAGADTGGNSTTGNGNASITTGDASVNVTIDNQFNSNQANVTCCPDGKSTPTPTPKKPGPGQSPTPTPPGGIGGPPSGDGGNGGGGNGGGNGGGGGVGGGGQVIGLSAADGENYTQLLFTASGIVCLLAGAYLTRKNYLVA
jgi:hypothetical protein